MRRRPFRRMTRRRAAAFLLAAVFWTLWTLLAPEADFSASFAPETSPASVRAADNAAQPLPTSTNGGGFAGDTLRVCTWNIHNYNVSNRWIGGRWTVAPKPEAERNAVADTIARINPDVVLLQEIGDTYFLDDLRSRLRSRGIDYPFSAVSKFDAVSRLALMSKIAPEKTFDFSDTDFTFGGVKRYSPRGALGARIPVLGAESVNVFALHLKSKVGARKTDENFTPLRHAEIRAIRARATSAAGGETALILFAGDFNDEPSRGLMRNFGSAFSVVPQSDSRGLNWTYHWKKRDIFYRYDFFVVSQPLLPKILKGVVVSDSEKGSDHRPVYVDIRVRGAEN